MEPVQQVSAPHLPLGRHRRHPDLHPLPAGGYLQCLIVSPEELTHNAKELQGTRPRHAFPVGLRLRRRRRWPHASSMLENAERLKDFNGLPKVELEKAITFFEKAEADATDAARLGGRAVSGAAPRHSTPARPATSAATASPNSLLRDAEFFDAGQPLRSFRIAKEAAARPRARRL